MSLKISEYLSLKTPFLLVLISLHTNGFYIEFTENMLHHYVCCNDTALTSIVIDYG